MKILKVLIVVLLAINCKPVLEEPNLEREAFKRILADMHIAEEMVSKFRLADRDSVRNLYFQDIATIHKVDTATITQQITILQSNPDYAFSLYQDVYKFIDNMSVDEASKKKKSK